jgi:NAD(P)-dependent dehydrogenase (short-subunit alcohol dehydrogenase family)
MAARLQEASIAINCVCPGLVPTALTASIANILPKDKITRLPAVMKAYDRFLDGTETGCAAEISVDNIYLRDQVLYADDAQEWICTVAPTLDQKLGQKPT